MKGGFENDLPQTLILSKFPDIFKQSKMSDVGERCTRDCHMTAQELCGGLSNIVNPIHSRF